MLVRIEHEGKSVLKYTWQLSNITCKYWLPWKRRTPGYAIRYNIKQKAYSPWQTVPFSHLMICGNWVILYRRWTSGLRKRKLCQHSSSVKESILRFLLIPLIPTISCLSTLMNINMEWNVIRAMTSPQSSSIPAVKSSRISRKSFILIDNCSRRYISLAERPCCLLWYVMSPMASRISRSILKLLLLQI
jgi:hypothetical protein